MREQFWARTEKHAAGDEWHAILDARRVVTVCGLTLEPPVEKRYEPPGHHEPACAACFVRATNVSIRPSTGDADRARQARAIIESNLYMVLGTSDTAGSPWATPVYFAVESYRDFYWVSSPEAQHSRNIAVHRDIGIVIFDSRAAIGTGQAVYVHARAAQVDEAQIDHGLDVFSARSMAHGGKPWSRNDVSAATGIRLYEAEAIDYSMLAKDGKPDHRVPVDPRS